jgi:hypothetical protein
VTLRGPPWPSFYLRDKIEGRSDERAICALPTPATPLSLDAPKPGMAFPCSVNDIDVPVGKAVAGCAHNDTIPIIFDDADQ